MTADWYDLGQRLRAAASGTVVSRLAGSPVLPPARPVAVRARQAGKTVTVTATIPGSGGQAAAGQDALSLLHDLGVNMTAGTWSTLVTDSPATLPALMSLAAAAGPEGDRASAAAHLAWCAERADYPGTTAAVPLAARSQDRWVTGTAPAAERDPATWRAWLAIPGDGCGAALAWLARLAAGDPLGLLSEIAEDDKQSWQAACSDHADGRDWRAPDSVGRAAVGLRSRCDAADLYQAALLTDPVYRRGAVHSGHVTTGTAASLPGPGRKISVTCDRMDTRLRPGADITGWSGSPADPGPATFRGTVEDSAVTGASLALVVATGTVNRPASQARVTLIPAPPARGSLPEGRRLYTSLYGTRRSWLTTGRTPAPARRDVPLDVLCAAADPD